MRGEDDENVEQRCSRIWGKADISRMYLDNNKNKSRFRTFRATYQGGKKKTRVTQHRCLYKSPTNST